MSTVSVRYIVHDVDDALAFYCEHLGFEVQARPAPIFAMLRRGDLRLLLSAPAAPGQPGALSSSRRSPRRSMAKIGAGRACTSNPRCSQ